MNNEYNFAPARVEWNNCHSDLLKDFLDQLHLNQIRYVILKNDDGLPYENHSKDVDIVIEPGTYKRAANIIRDCYKRHGVSYYTIHKFERLRCWYGMTPSEHFAIHIDLLEGFLHKGFEMFPFGVLYDHSKDNNNGVRVLDELMGSVVLLMHSTICYHSIKEKYARLITTTYSGYRKQFITILQQLLGRNEALVMARLLDKADYKHIAQRGKVFSHASKWRILRERPLFTCYNVSDFLWEKVCRIALDFNRYNRLISVHAPDGTGKTTFIQHLGSQLGFYYVCAANDFLSTHHFRPCVLPNLGAVGEKAGVMKQDTNFIVPHRAKPVNPISSFIRMTYYWIDYLVGMPLILRKSAQFDKVTIFDRYIYDFLVDPERTRIRLPYGVRRLFSRLVEQPQIVFVLQAPAEVIYQRKQELSVDEIRHQLKGFQKLSCLGKRVHFLDATKTPSELAEDAIKIILDRFTTRL